jgi:hypothetical protein
MESKLERGEKEAHFCLKYVFLLLVLAIYLHRIELLREVKLKEEAVPPHQTCDTSIRQRGLGIAQW